jgi:hypothetical protein
MAKNAKPTGEGYSAHQREVGTPALMLSVQFVNFYLNFYLTRRNKTEKDTIR